MIKKILLLMLTIFLIGGCGNNPADDGKIKTTVEFLTEDENYYFSTEVFYLVPNANDNTGTYPWSVDSFENAMDAPTLYKKLPFKEMSDEKT